MSHKYTIACPPDSKVLIHLTIHSFHQYLLNIHYVQSIVRFDDCAGHGFPIDCLTPAQGYVFSVLTRVQLFPTPWTVAHQAPLSMGFSRQEYWCELPLPPPADLPDPGIKLESHVSPALAAGFFTTKPPGKPPSTDKI